MNQRLNTDFSAVLLEAVANHLNYHVHELKHTFSSARIGSDGLELYVGSRYRCEYSSDTAALVAWAKTMTDVTAQVRKVDDSVHLTLKGKLVDTTPAEITAVEVGDDARAWIDTTCADDRTDVTVTLDLLNEIAAQLDAATERVTA